MVNGLFVDWWTLGHIFVAFLYAGIFYFGVKKFWLSGLLVILLNVLWESWEISINIPEVFTNVIGDVVVGIFAFFIFWIMFSKYERKIKKIRLTFHDKFLDIWSLSHFFSGVITAWILFNIGLDFSIAFIINIFIAIIWEVLEEIRKVGENLLNHTGDLITCILGFLIVSSLKFFFLVELKPSLLLISFLIIIFIKILAHKKDL
jgi:hypothetical protein